MFKITNKQVKVHTDFYNFMPRWELEKAEYEKAIIKSVDDKPESRFKSKYKSRRRGDLEPIDHWPREPAPSETVFYDFLER